MQLWLLLELPHQLVNFSDFFLILALLKVESMLFEQQKVHSVEALEVVIRSVNKFIVLALHTLRYCLYSRYTQLLLIG